MSRAFTLIFLILALGLHTAPARSSELLTSVDADVVVPPELQDHLDSSLVIRHRFVEVDIEFLWNMFESARDVEDLGSVGPIDVGLFEDLSVELKLMKVNHRYWWSNAILVTTHPDYGKNPDANIFVDMTLKRNESVSARIWAAGDIYFIAPVEDGPLHVITQVDPDKMPALD